VSIRRSGEERRSEVAEAALKIIARDGLRGFTTSALAQEVGIAEGTIFRHFGSKEEIVLAAIEIAEEMLAGGLPADGGDPLERLGRFIVARVKLIREHRGLFRILFSDQLAQAASEDGARRVAALKRRSLDAVRECLREAGASGLLAAEVDPALLGYIVHGLALSLVFDPAADDPSRAPAPEAAWAVVERLIRRG
jgi:AcrR family transcriptional regulator